MTINRINQGMVNIFYFWGASEELIELIDAAEGKNAALERTAKARLIHHLVEMIYNWEELFER